MGLYTTYMDIKPVGEETRSYGVDFGPHLVVHKVTRDYVVIKSKGHMGWSGRGEQAYRETTFYVFNILETTETKWHLDMVADFGAR